jgi:hypothetical protein
MRQIDRIRRIIAKNVERRKKQHFIPNKPSVEEESGKDLEQLPKNSTSIKSNDDFIVSEKAKSIPQSLEENVEVAQQDIQTSTEKTSSPRKNFPKKKKE